MAVLDAELRAQHLALATHLHGGHEPQRDRIPAGVSVGIFPDIDGLLAAVQGYVDDGYQRIKLKIQPGWDLEPVREVRALIGPTLGLQVDANTAYTRTDFEHLRHLDEAGLLLIEQPLPEDDLLGHRDLAAAIATPVCLDESIISLASARDAIDIGAAEIINIKPGRVGGYLEARRIHDLCRDRDIPAWCGGMLETGIGRSANAALASLPGFTLPGDISAADRFYARDIVTQPVTLVDGCVLVPTTAGLGSEVDPEILDSVTRSTRLLGNESR
jgi:o-succinylbenzoate synthase